MSVAGCSERTRSMKRFARASFIMRGVSNQMSATGP